MSGIGGLLAILARVRVCVSASLALSICLLVGAAAAESEAPVAGGFVTLEKTSSGLLKYSSTAKDGSFTIEDLPKGRYRMSITPPGGDRGPDFKSDVLGAFNNMSVIGWGGRSERKAENAGGILYETGVRIPNTLWKEGAIWLDVDVSDRTVTGKFTYVE